MSFRPREWDAATYDELADPQSRWGLRILGLLDLSGDETVLEAGCGTGRDTARLLDRLPAGRVVAVDASARMLEQARGRLNGRLDRVDLVRADLSEPLPISSPVDVVFSVAAFHWIGDHGRLFRNLFAVLRPGGRLAADCGGKGNVAGVSAAISEVLGEPAESGVWNFADPDETAEKLAAAGFVDVEVKLHGEPAAFEDPATFRAFLETVILGTHLERIPGERRSEFVDEVAGRLPDRSIDYVRLTITGRKGSA